MGFFSFLSSLTPQTASDRIVASSIVSNLSNTELDVAAAIGAEPHLLLKERILFRLAFSLSSVGFFHDQQPHPRVRDLHELLESKAFHYIYSVPGVSGEQAGQLWARARNDYMVKQPSELAGAMMTSIHFSEFRPSSSQAMSAFLQLVHTYARESMTQAGELANKLRNS